MSVATLKASIENAAPFTIFPAPDMDVLRAGRRAAVSMPSELFGEAWDLLNLIAQGTGAPVDYPAIGFIGACASLIGAKRKVRPYTTSSWAEPCILWVGAVGDPSANKSPALDAITGPLRAIEADHAQDHIEAMRTWQADFERSKLEKAAWMDLLKEAQKGGFGTPRIPDNAVEPDEPQRRRTMVMDATPEAVGAILAANPVGTLSFRDELAGWLSSFDRYSPGGRTFWLEAYNGKTFVIDRKGSKAPLVVPFCGVSVAGGIQPERLADALLSSVDDGLVARFLWAWPDPAPYARPRQLADMRLLEDIYRRLDGLSWGINDEGKQTAITMPLSASAADIFEAWGRENREGLDDSGALFKSFAGKMPGVVLRLALMAELASWAMRAGPEPTEVSAAMLAAAADWVDRYAKPMAQRVYGDASLPAVERNASILARYILKSRFEQINKRDLKRSPHKSHLPTMRCAGPLDEAIAYLSDSGWLLEEGSRDGPTNGRKSGDYLVNPAIYGGA
jgi:putative DNA primase/helicase